MIQSCFSYLFTVVVVVVVVFVVVVVSIVVIVVLEPATTIGRFLAICIARRCNCLL